MLTKEQFQTVAALAAIRWALDDAAMVEEARRARRGSPTGWNYKAS